MTKSDATGTTTLHSGPMFSGKSDTLLRRARVQKLARRTVLLFRYRQGREGEAGVQSRSGAHMDARDYTTADEVRTTVLAWQAQNGARVDHVFIDEGQFMNHGAAGASGCELRDLCLALNAQGVHVDVAALDTYADQAPFPQVQALLPVAVKRFRVAVCNMCGLERATLTRRKSGNPSERGVAPGDTELYEAVCAQCHALAICQPPQQ